MHYIFNIQHYIINWPHVCVRAPAETLTQYDTLRSSGYHDERYVHYVTLAAWNLEDTGKCMRPIMASACIACL